MRARAGVLAVGLAFGLVLGAGLVGAAQAQRVPRSPERQEVWRQMSVADAKKELFGIDMSGHVYGDSGYTWRECIEPGGQTLYEIDGREERGQLRINEQGHACFSYPPGDRGRESCFGVSRAGAGYEFRSGGLTFHATRIRKVTSCRKEPNISALEGRHAG